ALCVTADQVRRAHKQGKIAALMGMEGGHMINNSLAVLRMYAELGVRYLTLTHSVNTDWADSSGDEPKHNGLTDFGKDVVRELNRLGVIVDVSHVSDKTFWDVMEVSRAPVIASHSSCRALSGHSRNMTDEMIKAMAAKGGVIQINYLDQFIDNDLYEYWRKARPMMRELAEKYPGRENAAKRRQEVEKAYGPPPRASWERIIDHIDHAVKLVDRRYTLDRIVDRFRPGDRTRHVYREEQRVEAALFHPGQIDVTGGVLFGELPIRLQLRRGVYVRIEH
ncbi:MAG TPA: membrane dipeptidase, partial [Blastocatellia bacterium]|nr:membrane dipeptidase [Blastocatellia bacterium]